MAAGAAFGTDKAAGPLIEYRIRQCLGLVIGGDRNVAHVFDALTQDFLQQRGAPSSPAGTEVLSLTAAAHGAPGERVPSGAGDCSDLMGKIRDKPDTAQIPGQFHLDHLALHLADGRNLEAIHPGADR